MARAPKVRPMRPLAVMKARLILEMFLEETRDCSTRRVRAAKVKPRK